MLRMPHPRLFMRRPDGTSADTCNYGKVALRMQMCARFIQCRAGAVGKVKSQRFGLAASPDRHLAYSCSRCLTTRVVLFCDWSRLGS